MAKANKAGAKKAGRKSGAAKAAGLARSSRSAVPEIVGVGIIGGGGIARGAHIPGYQKLSNVKVVAVADTSAEAREATAQQFGIETTYADFHEMLKRDDIQAVSVTTPNFMHAEATIEALKAGKHVLCEKPLAMNAKEGKAMVEAARKSGRKLMCGFNNRFQPGIQVLKRFADSGAFGTMYYARSQALRRRGIPGWGLFISKEKNGGGPLIDIGVHILDATLYILGFPKPVAVSGQTYAMFGKRPDVIGLMGQWDYKNFTVEDFAVALVRFEDGSTLVLESSFCGDMEADKFTFQIFGDRGGATFGPLKMFSEQNRTLLDITPVHLPGNVNTHAEEMKQFIDAIVNDTPVPIPGEEALQVTRIIDAIYESGDKGREVKL